MDDFLIFTPETWANTARQVAFTNPLSKLTAVMNEAEGMGDGELTKPLAPVKAAMKSAKPFLKSYRDMQKSRDRYVRVAGLHQYLAVMIPFTSC